MGCVIRPQAPFGTRDLLASNPALKRRAYSRLYLRDSKATVFPCRQNGPGVQRWIELNPVPLGRFRRQFKAVRRGALIRNRPGRWTLVFLFWTLIGLSFASQLY